MSDSASSRSSVRFSRRSDAGSDAGSRASQSRRYCYSQPIPDQISAIDVALAALKRSLPIGESIPIEDLPSHLNKHFAAFSDTLIRILSDLSHFYRSESRRRQNPFIEDAIADISEALPVLSRQVHTLGKFEIDLIVAMMTHGEEEEAEIGPEIAGIVEEAESVARTFVETLWGFGKSCADRNDTRGFELLRGTLQKHLLEHYKRVNDLITKVITAVDASGVIDSLCASRRAISPIVRAALERGLDLMPIFEKDLRFYSDLENFVAEQDANAELRVQADSVESELFETVEKSWQMGIEGPNAEDLANAMRAFLKQAAEFGKTTLPAAAQFLLDVVVWRGVDDLMQPILADFVKNGLGGLDRAYAREIELIDEVDLENEDVQVDELYGEIAGEMERTWKNLVDGLSICRKAALRLPPDSWVEDFEKRSLQKMRTVLEKHIKELREKRIGVFAAKLGERGRAKEARKGHVQAKLFAKLSVGEKRRLELLRWGLIASSHTLFEVFRGLLIGLAHRPSDKDDEQGQILTQLRDLELECAIDLRDQRALYASAMDVEGVKAIDAQMFAHHRRFRDDLCVAYEDCFRDYVQQRIEAYRQILIQIDDDADEAEDNEQHQLAHRFGDLHEGQHLNALVLIEMQNQLEILRETKRIEESGGDVEKMVTRLLMQGRYVEAEKAKKELFERREKEVRERKKELEKKRDDAIKAKLLEQEKELKVLQEKFDAAIVLIRAQKERNITDVRGQFICELTHEIPRRVADTMTAISLVQPAKAEEKEKQAIRESGKAPSVTAKAVLKLEVGKKEVTVDQKKLIARYYDVLREVLAEEEKNNNSKNDCIREVLDYFKRK
jgi:hypothetical protein